MNMPQGVSVVLCCFNSVQRLKPTLEHLAKQKLNNELACEIILVNNNSTDSSAAFANEIWEKIDSAIPLTVVNEPMPGLSHARLKGVKGAKYKYILFCDDDNWLDESYIQNAYRIMKANRKIGALGGWSETTLPVEKLPFWFKEYQTGYAVGKQSSNSGDVTDRGWLWGAGLVVRKDIYMKAFSRFKSLLTGRSGRQLISHEDVEICKRIILLGYKLYYSEELFFKHDVPVNRITEEYRDRLFNGFENGKEILHMYDKQISINKLKKIKKLKIVLYIIFRVLKKIVNRKGFNDFQWEIENLFLLTGIKLGKISQNQFVIKNIINR